MTSLEAVVYHEQHSFVQNNSTNNNDEIFDLLHPLFLNNWVSSSSEHDQILDAHWNYNNNYSYVYDYSYPSVNDAAPEVVVRPKRRRRERSKKKKEEIENQRMTHIAVERNRRKQMNDYLFTLRSFMPTSYVQRGDQASIIGGAINFVKELEQKLQCLSAKKQPNENPNNTSCVFSSSSSTCLPNSNGDGGDMAAEVEVTMVERHALLKIRAKKPLKKLSKLVSGLQSLRLSILHLNVSNLHGLAFYTFSLKVEDIDESKVRSMDEIAGAVYQLLPTIQQDSII